MKTTLTVKAMSQGLAIANRAINKRSSLPILNHALLRTRGESLDIVGTDLDVTCAVTLPTGQGLDGAICAPAHRMADILKACSHDVEFESNDKNQLAIRNGSQFSLDGLSPVEFPPTPILKEARRASVDLAKLRLALERIECAQSTDETRYVLNGVFFKFDGSLLNLVATDGRRLALTEIAATVSPMEFNAADLPAAITAIQAEVTEQNKLANAAKVEFDLLTDTDTDEKWHEISTAKIKAERSAYRAGLELKRLETMQTWAANSGAFILPSKTVKVLLASLPKARRNEPAAEIVMQWDAATAKFTFNRGEHTVQITSKLVEGNYPNYRQVIPTECLERVTFNRAELLHAITTAAKLTSEKDNSVKLHFTANLLTVTANAPGNGEAKSEVLINYAGKELAIAFAPRYVREALESVDVETVTGEFTDYMSPSVFKTAAEGDGIWTYVVMPMRLS